MLITAAVAETGSGPECHGYDTVNKNMSRVCQVMEKAEVLRDADANLLPALLRLQELVRKHRATHTS